MGDAVLTQFFSGFSLVAILIIAALGLAVIFGVAGVINMAHGEFIMVGAYVASVVQSGLGGNTFWSIPICFVAVGLLGLVVERTVIRGLYDRPLETLLATWGVSLILIVIIKMIFGTELHYVGSPEILQGGFPAPGNLPFPWYRLFLIVLSILLLVATVLLFFRTKFGLAVRAVRRNRSMSAAMGINTARVDMVIFAYGSGLAGVAGAVLAPIKTVSPNMGFPYAVDSFMVLVMGGVGNLLGVPVGAAIIGEGETILAFLFNSVIGKLLVFLLIVLVIRIVPRGIFGYQERTLGQRR